MKKNYRNKQITTKDESKQDSKKFPFSFKGNPPLTIWATNREEAEKEFKSLKVKK